jgi:DNA gyrase subunit A
MGRNTSGVKGIRLGKGDYVVGMVVADPTSALLTACENGYGKRTPFGPNDPLTGTRAEGPEGDDDAEATDAAAEPAVDEAEDDAASGARYRTQRRGGKGLRDIKTTERNGKVVSIVAVRESDELLMISTGGKLQRIAARDVSEIGRNTQGVRIMSMDESDKLAAVVCVPPEEISPADGESPAAPTPDVPPSPE